MFVHCVLQTRTLDLVAIAWLQLTYCFAMQSLDAHEITVWLPDWNVRQWNLHSVLHHGLSECIQPQNNSTGGFLKSSNDWNKVTIFSQLLRTNEIVTYLTSSMVACNYCQWELFTYHKSMISTYIVKSVPVSNNWIEVMHLRHETIMMPLAVYHSEQQEQWLLLGFSPERNFWKLYMLVERYVAE